MVLGRVLDDVVGYLLSEDLGGILQADCAAKRRDCGGY
jgi:hypothetical protein